MSPSTTRGMDEVGGARDATPVERERGYSTTLVSFARALRADGVPVSPASVNEAARALTLIDPLDRDGFRFALQSTLLTDVSQVPTFDRLFERYWADPVTATEPVDESSPPVDLDLDARPSESPPGSLERLEREDVEVPGLEEGLPGAPELEDDRSDAPSPGGSAPDGAPATQARTVAFELGQSERSEPVRAPSTAPTDAERLRLLVRELGRQLGTLRGFETVPQPVGELDLRRSLGLRTRAPTAFPRVAKRETSARLVCFVDVSRSMLRNMDQPFLFRFLFECVSQLADVRVFFFDTSVREVTDHFVAANVDGVRAALADAGAEWGAGTTIGACLGATLAEDPFVVDYDTHSVVISDGWDAGDLDVLQQQMVVLSRRSRSVVWLNPSATSAAYAPEVGGMRTALPYVDRFAGFASIDDLATLVDDLRSADARQR